MKATQAATEHRAWHMGDTRPGHSPCFWWRLAVLPTSVPLGLRGTQEVTRGLSEKVCSGVVGKTGAAGGRIEAGLPIGCKRSHFLKLKCKENFVSPLRAEKLYQGLNIRLVQK